MLKVFDAEPPGMVTVPGKLTAAVAKPEIASKAARFTVRGLAETTERVTVAVTVPPFSLINVEGIVTRTSGATVGLPTLVALISSMVVTPVLFGRVRLVSDSSAVTANRPAVFAALTALRILAATVAAVSLAVNVTRRLVVANRALLLSNSKVTVLTPSLIENDWPSLSWLPGSD